MEQNDEFSFEEVMQRIIRVKPDEIPSIKKELPKEEEEMEDCEPEEESLEENPLEED